MKRIPKTFDPEIKKLKKKINDHKEIIKDLKKKIKNAEINNKKENVDEKVSLILYFD